MSNPSEVQTAKFSQECVSNHIYFALQTLLQNQSDGEREVIKYVLTDDGQNIVDRRFLPIEARERCEGMDVVWGNEPCGSTGNEYSYKL